MHIFTIYVHKHLVFITVTEFANILFMLPVTECSYHKIEYLRVYYSLSFSSRASSTCLCFFLLLNGAEFIVLSDISREFKSWLKSLRYEKKFQMCLFTELHYTGKLLH